jgi:UDP-N-acetylmuramate--alanine ligase
VPQLADVPAAIARLSRPGDVVITLGAGSIGALPELVIEAIEARAGMTPAEAGPAATPAKSPAGGGAS